MKKILTFHSYRRGAGKTHIASCVASLLASEGYRVGIMDTSFLSPSIHILFHLEDCEIQKTLNHFILGQCSLEDSVYDISHCLVRENINVESAGKLYISPASLESHDILQVLRQGSNLDRLMIAQQEMTEKYKLDILVIDTYSGLNEVALHSTALCSALTLIMRPDKQDYDGTGILLDIAKKLYVPNISLVMNEVPFDFSYGEIENELQTKYQCTVGAVIPHIEAIQALASNDVFVLRYPEHPAAQILTRLAHSLINHNQPSRPSSLKL